MVEHRITLVTRDGREVTFECDAATDVISAAERAAVLLPSLCRDGGCGACLGHCAAGEYQLGACNEAVLSPAQAARRDVLLCRTYPQSDLWISAPYDAAHIGFGSHTARQASIVVLETVAERTLRLVLNWLEDGGGKAVEFEPGQCMELEIPDSDIRRAYSLANTGNWRGEMEFLIRLQPQGRFSEYLSTQAAVGQVLNVYGPNGAFGLQAGSFDPAVFVAGGTGLTPFLSILRRMAEWGEDRLIHLLFGVNREAELFYLDELQRLQQAIPSLVVTLCVWQPQADWVGFSGTPADALRQCLADLPGPCDVYLCGPPALVAAATDIASAHGVDEQRLFAERFG